MQVALDNKLAYNLVDDSNILNLIDTVRQGIKFSNFTELVKISPFNLTEWSDFLHLSERTMQRYKKEKTTFSNIHSEKILQITLLFNYGIDVFGSFVSSIFKMLLWAGMSMLTR